jgi:hypothetical protein
LRTFDEEIARRSQEAADSGELRRADGNGKPVGSDPGWDATPAALRVTMKVLKDAGAAPPEIALFHERARLRRAVDFATDASERQRLLLQLAELEQKLALRLEALRRDARL